MTLLLKDVDFFFFIKAKDLLDGSMNENFLKSQKGGSETIITEANTFFLLCVYVCVCVCAILPYLSHSKFSRNHKIQRFNLI